jgi:hypothetical protein
MDIQDGFIVGIYNYCDSWCETCAFTARCRVFADMAEAEAALDPQLQAIVAAPPLPQEVDPPPPGWMQALIDEMNEASAQAIAAGLVPPQRPPLASDHEAIRLRASGYCERVHAWLRARGFYSVADPRDPRAVITWFHTLIPAKVLRALHGLAEADEAPGGPADHDGSAKVALLAIERSHGAWLQIVERGLGTTTEVDPFIADLVWLGESLERAFPGALCFVRPGLDEPEAVARMLAEEDGPFPGS